MKSHIVKLEGFSGHMIPVISPQIYSYHNSMVWLCFNKFYKNKQQVKFGLWAIVYQPPT